jgi:hypothetical protein
MKKAKTSRKPAARGAAGKRKKQGLLSSIFGSNKSKSKTTTKGGKSSGKSKSRMSGKSKSNKSDMKYQNVKTKSRENKNITRQKKSIRIEAAYPHFRYYKKSNHPALIVGEQTKKDNPSVEEYRYRKVMHGDKEGGRNNEIVYPNPDPNDPEPMKIARRVRHEEKENFELRPLNWKYPDKK